jgi:putative membrane protein
MTSDVHAPAPALTDDQKAMIADLQGKRGKAFDTAYIADQKTAHQQALSLMQDYAQNGDDPKLKAAAAKIVPVVQEHIDMLNKMSE